MSSTTADPMVAGTGTVPRPHEPEAERAVLGAILLDPGALPGTGTPEPGGWTFRDLESVLHRLANRTIIGADVVELSPDLDPSGVSAVTAARCVREILLI